MFVVYGSGLVMEILAHHNYCRDNSIAVVEIKMVVTPQEAAVAAVVCIMRAHINLANASPSALFPRRMYKSLLAFACCGGTQSGVIATKPATCSAA